MKDEAAFLALIDILTLTGLFSSVGALLYLALITGFVPVLPNVNWKSGLAKYGFSVGSGVGTWVFTQVLFGHGIEDASLTGIATAAIIGGITKFTGIGSA